MIDSTNLQKATIVLIAFWWGLPALNAADPTPARIQFNRDIRPILANFCYQCHGPDEAQRKSDLRLDVEEAAFADLGEYRAILPEDPAKSELYLRITSTDPDKRMPPDNSTRKLTKRQVELIRLWIEQGAPWQKHWSFISPRPMGLPELTDTKWPRNEIDHFVLAQLESAGLVPSAESARTTLIRRLTFDLTGLPPTLDEIDAFLSDQSLDAYEKVVDRLLRSPRYGERMADRWLDLARYADTSGYQNDGPRDMWRWRDWVIAAYNANMRFDQFTIEQLAGDLLDNPSLNQRIATGFNRNHRGNAEGGIIPEEFQVEYVVDRVETTSTVWLGLTMGCGRCHDHKYDPFTQKEFYQIFAYFNNVPESGRAVKQGNSPPFIKAPTAQQQQQLEGLDRQLNEALKKFQGLEKELNQAQSAWEKSLHGASPVHWTITHGLLAHYALEGNLKNDRPTAAAPSSAATVDQQPPASSKPHPRFADGTAAFTAGKFGQAAEFDGKRFINAGDVGNFGFFDKFSIGAWIYPTAQHGGTIISRMEDASRASGYHIRMVDGRIQVNLIKRWLDDAIRVETANSFPTDRWSHVMMTYDGSRVAGGVSLFVDGHLESLMVHLDGLNQSFANDEPLRIGGGGKDVFQGAIDDVRVYDRWLAPDEIAIIATDSSINQIAKQSPARRTVGQSKKLREYFLAHGATRPLQEAHRNLLDLRQRKRNLLETLPTVMVMQDMKTPRETHILQRGQYDKPGERVSPNVPAMLSALAVDEPNNRLGLARWLVHPTNPLTARVAANRYWQMYFGSGLVRTLEDFGVQGDLPSHPKLLDWLANEFEQSGWNVKALQKKIVMSSTYRQSSRVTRPLLETDPDNRLLARGPRFRLTAQMIRDLALAVSGLYVEKIGGPSVKPYQPAGLWEEIASNKNYELSTGGDLYRRSLYTYWKRTVANPTMMNFDASARETCVPQRSRTNTPLQALNLMNEVTFVEAARVLAERIIEKAGATPSNRIAYAFRLCTARRPQKNELRILLNSFQHFRVQFNNHPDDALKLVETGASPRSEKTPASELAAYTAVASLILNLDETVTKE